MRRLIRWLRRLFQRYRDDDFSDDDFSDDDPPRRTTWVG
jgi:hypothetical protein